MLLKERRRSRYSSSGDRPKTRITCFATNNSVVEKKYARHETFPGTNQEKTPA
jgi:hypothetical protein